MTTLTKLNITRVSTMKALIIYDNFFSAAKANTALQHSEQNADLVVQWSIRPWRVDMLKFPPTAEEALTEALDAHLIVFAGRIARSLPFWLQDWLEHWAKCRQIKDAALAVIGMEIEEPLSAAAKSDLSQFARRHDMNLLFNNNITIAPFSVGDRSSIIEGPPHECEVSISPTRQQ